MPIDKNADYQVVRETFSTKTYEYLLADRVTWTTDVPDPPPWKLSDAQDIVRALPTSEDQIHFVTTAV